MVGACPKFQQANLVDRMRFSLKQQEGGTEGGTKGGREGRGREGKRKEGLDCPGPEESVLPGC